MDTSQRFALLGVCAASWMMVGCAAPYPYQPNPYQPYPGGPYGQPGYNGPGGPIPQGGVQLNAPTPTPIDAGADGSSGGDAPMWNPDSNSGTGGNNSDNNVPFYDDPASGDLGPSPTSNKPDMFDNEKNAFETDNNPFGLNEIPTANDSGIRNVAFTEESVPASAAASSRGELEAGSPSEIDQAKATKSAIVLANADFEAPIERSEQPKSLSLPYNQEEIPNPFGHDAEGYRFLRGLVAYDDQLQAWSIIYDDKPVRDDEYGGVFTLADHPGLTVLNDSDVIYVEGRISETLQDAFGKPRYIVEHLNKLKPRTQE